MQTDDRISTYMYARPPRKGRNRCKGDKCLNGQLHQYIHFSTERRRERRRVLSRETGGGGGEEAKEEAMRR